MLANFPYIVSCAITHDIKLVNCHKMSVFAKCVGTREIRVVGLLYIPDK